MANPLHLLSGGRPMKRDGVAFIDTVTHKPVYFWDDAFGRRWLAEGAWSLFRVRVGRHPPAYPVEPPSGHGGP